MQTVKDFPDLEILVKQTVKEMRIRANRLFLFGNTNQDIKSIIQKPMDFIDSTRHILTHREFIDLKYWYMCEITNTLISRDDGIFNFLQYWLDKDLPQYLVNKRKEIEDAKG